MTIATADAARRTQSVAAFSFDVFDTFLLRACTTPDGVFERTYELSGISETHPNASENFVQHRVHAEARARKAAKDAADRPKFVSPISIAIFRSGCSDFTAVGWTTLPRPNSMPSSSCAGSIPICFGNMPT